MRNGGSIIEIQREREMRRETADTLDDLTDGYLPALEPGHLSLLVIWILLRMGPHRLWKVDVVIPLWGDVVLSVPSGVLAVFTTHLEPRVRFQK